VQGRREGKCLGSASTDAFTILRLRSRLPDALGVKLGLSDCRHHSPDWRRLDTGAISVTGRGGLQACEMLRISHCLDSRLTDSGIGCAQLPRGIIFLLLVLISVRGLVSRELYSCLLLSEVEAVTNVEVTSAVNNGVDRTGHGLVEITVPECLEGLKKHMVHLTIC
jgi:hypothetical protein